MLEKGLSRIRGIKPEERTEQNRPAERPCEEDEKSHSLVFLTDWA